VADDAALRNRRLRAHKAGNHELCSSRCKVRRVANVAKLGPAPESVFDAVRLFARSVDGWPEDDPRRVRVAVAFQLALQADGGDVAAMKELLRVINDLVVFDIDRDPDTLDALKYLGLEEALAWIAKHDPAGTARIREAEEHRERILAQARAQGQDV
jgi:hypothetical protein